MSPDTEATLSGVLDRVRVALTAVRGEGKRRELASSPEHPTRQQR